MARTTQKLLYCLLACAPGLLAHAQNSNENATKSLPDNNSLLSIQEQPAPPPGQKIEHLHTEDSAASIDELRVGGEVRSTVVTPKLPLPSYTMTPSKPGAVGLNASDGAQSQSRWNILSF